MDLLTKENIEELGFLFELKSDISEIYKFYPNFKDNKLIYNFKLWWYKDKDCIGIQGLYDHPMIICSTCRNSKDLINIINLAKSLDIPKNYFVNDIIDKISK